MTSTTGVLIVSTDVTQITWLWRWLPLRLSKRLSMSSQTVLLRTTVTRTIVLYLMIWLLGSNHLQFYGSSVVVCLDRGYPCFRNFYSTIPVDVVRVKFYVNRLFDPACVPMRITINKLYFAPKRAVAGVVTVFWNGGGLGTGKSDVSGAHVLWFYLA